MPRRLLAQYQAVPASLNERLRNWEEGDYPDGATDQIDEGPGYRTFLMADQDSGSGSDSDDEAAAPAAAAAERSSEESSSASGSDDDASSLGNELSCSRRARPGAHDYKSVNTTKYY